MITLQKDGETVDRHAKDRCGKTQSDKRQHWTEGCLGKHKAETTLIELRQQTQQDKKRYDMSTGTLSDRQPWAISRQTAVISVNTLRPRSRGLLFQYMIQ